jgi:type II secretory pathway pseudopilin PulG
MSNVSTNTRKRSKRTYLWDLNISHRDFSDDDEKRQPWRNDTFIYQRKGPATDAYQRACGRMKAVSDARQYEVIIRRSQIRSWSGQGEGRV